MTDEINEEDVETPEEETPEDKSTETEEEPEEETPEAPAEEEKETEKPEDKEEEAGDESKEDKLKRTPRLMEVYKHKIAEKKWSKEKDDLEMRVADLTVKIETKNQPERAKLIRDFAEKSGMESELVEEFVKIAETGQANLSKELESLRADIKKGSEERAWVEEDKKFEQDYEKNVISLLEVDKIPKENLPRLKKLLKSLAFSEEYAKTPLPVIYRGVEDFKQFLEKGRKSGEPARSGIRGEEKKVSILDMTDEEYNKHIEEGIKNEQKFDIRRDGRAISDK